VNVSSNAGTQRQVKSDECVDEMSEQRKTCTGQPSNAYTVEKMTATSTTSPKSDPSNEIEDREIQNALDKKRKKRIKHSNSKDSKHIKIDGPGSSIHQYYFDASRELETTHRISQDLPNCNWLEQKIKLSENKKSSKSSQRINNLFGSDSEEDNLVVDDVFEENAPSNTIQSESSVPEVIRSVPSTSTIPKSERKSLQVVHSTLPKYDSDELETKHSDVKTASKIDQENQSAEFVFSPPCITIAEEEGQQPIQIRVSIKGESDQYLFDNLHTDENKTKAKSNGQNCSPQNFSLENQMKKLEQTNKERSVQNAEAKSNNGTKLDEAAEEQKWLKQQEESNEKIKSLLALKEAIEKDIESLKNKKIQEMEQLIEIKTTKEKFMNELESLRMDVFKEKNLLDSFKAQNLAREKNMNQTSDQSPKPQYLGKTQTEGGYQKSDNTTPSSHHVQSPVQSSHSPKGVNSSTNNPPPPTERHPRYPHENVPNVPNLAPTLGSARQNLEQQHRDFIEYRQKLYERNAVISPNSDHLPRDYNRPPMSLTDFSRSHTQDVYKQMLESAARASRLPGERPRELEPNSSIPYIGFQPPGMLLKPGIGRQYEQEILERTRQSLQQYPGLPPAISQQYSKGLPPLPPDTTLSQITQRSSYPPHSAHPAVNPNLRSSLPSSLVSPSRPNPESVPSIEASESKCEACGAAANFMCSACKGAHYCSTECQRGHWLVHNRSCQQGIRR